MLFDVDEDKHALPLALHHGGVGGDVAVGEGPVEFGSG